jgi:hypothetical protein
VYQRELARENPLLQYGTLPRPFQPLFWVSFAAQSNPKKVITAMNYLL